MKPQPSEPKFICYAHKPKALMLAKTFSAGCQRLGVECLITDKPHSKPGFIGVFYGITNDTYSTFMHYKIAGRAIYLDNGWLSTRDAPTFRFSWNSVQPFLRDMEPVFDMTRFKPLPKLDRKPQRDLALLMLQSPQYFEYLGLPYTRDVWVRATTRLLKMRGYRVECREKPQKRDPTADTFFDQMARAGIVVSLNSASCLKALRWGIPAYCTLDCTLSPLAPVRLPMCGKAGAARREDVIDLCRRIAHYEFDTKQLETGQAISLFMSIPDRKRRGYWYGQ